MVGVVEVVWVTGVDGMLSESSEFSSSWVLLGPDSFFCSLKNLSTFTMCLRKPHLEILGRAGNAYFQCPYFRLIT